MGMWVGKGSVSVPYSWLLGEFESFSSVTLKVSFSSPGCYHHTGPDNSKLLPRRKKKRKKEMSQTSGINVFWKRQKWHIIRAQTSTDATLQIVVINRGNKSTLFILRHSWASCRLVCKALLIPIVIVIITFCYAAQGQCKQSREQFGFSNGEAMFTWHLQRNSSSTEMSWHVKLCADHNVIKSEKVIINRECFYKINHVSRSSVPTLEH